MTNELKSICCGADKETANGALITPECKKCGLAFVPTPPEILKEEKSSCCGAEIWDCKTGAFGSGEDYQACSKCHKRISSPKLVGTEIEHCSEPECPECNLVAYEKGRADERQKIIKQAKEILQRGCLDFCLDVNGTDYCKNCGLSPDTLSALEEGK